MSLQQEAEERRKRIAQLRAQRKGAGTKLDTTQDTTLDTTPAPLQESKPQAETNQIYESNGETVQLLAQDIQDRIFAKSREIASLARNPELRHDNKVLGTEDLKLALQDQFDRAQLETDAALGKYLQRQATHKASSST